LTYTPPQLGQTQQLVPQLTQDELTPVDAATKTFVQEVTGVFLFYSRAVDPTMLTAVNKISMQQAAPTQATLKAIDRLLSYAERYPNATVEIYIEYISGVIPTVCSSVFEAEYAALFLTGRAITNARLILHDLGHKQKATNIICDNSYAVGIANDTVKQRRSKAIDMRYH